MCTILLAWRHLPNTPLVLAANRDELIGRPSAPPSVLDPEHPGMLGGHDLLAGGTWLAVDTAGRVSAVTNRWPGAGEPPSRDPARQSRGDIPLSLLTRAREDALPAFLERLGPGRYNPVNVLYVSPEEALVAQVDDSGPPRVIHLEPGLHVLTVYDLDDPARPKVDALRHALDAAATDAREAATLAEAMRHVLAGHDTPTGNSVDAPCVHGDVYGTVSASSVVITTGGVDYRHAPGRPCVTPFERVESPSGSDARSRAPG